MTTAPLPRVTEILAAVGLGPDYAEVPPAILLRAASRGTAVHEAIGEHLAGTLWGVDAQIQPRLDAFQRFLSDSGYAPIETPEEFRNPEFPHESTLVHPYGFTGHIDPGGIGWLHGVRALVDWKTTVRLSASLAYQLAGYRLLWRHVRPAERIEISLAVQLRADGGYRVWDPEKERPYILAADAEAVFLAALTVYRAQRRR